MSKEGDHLRAEWEANGKLIGFDTKSSGSNKMPEFMDQNNDGEDKKKCQYGSHHLLRDKVKSIINLSSDIGKFYLYRHLSNSR